MVGAAPARSAAAPRREQIGALIGAIALYARQHAPALGALAPPAARRRRAPARADSYALTAIGYAVNNVLPARAGDAVRVVLMAPRAQASRRTVLGTIVAERLLDVGVILVLFLVVGYAVLGEVGAGSVEWIALATAAVIAGVAVRSCSCAATSASTTSSRRCCPRPRGLLSAHGALLVAMTFGIWIIEALRGSRSAPSVGFAMSFLEGLYLVALASVFALIPSGPGYAGTQDAAAVIGIKAIGGTGATAVSYLVMLRFVLLVPITVVGFLLLVTRYGGLGAARAARAATTRRDEAAARAARLVAYARARRAARSACASTTSATARSTTTRARTRTSPGSSSTTATTTTSRCCTGRCGST